MHVLFSNFDPGPRPNVFTYRRMAILNYCTKQHYCDGGSAPRALPILLRDFNVAKRDLCETYVGHLKDRLDLADSNLATPEGSIFLHQHYCASIRNTTLPISLELEENLMMCSMWWYDITS